MSLEPLATWQSTFKAQMPPVAVGTWPLSMTNWYAERFNTPNLDLPGLTLSTSPLPAVFGNAPFMALFSTLAPGLSQAAAMMIVANAWEAGLLASIVTVAPGSSIGAPSPATTWSAVASSIFDPPSIAAGKAKILELVGADNVADALDAQMPVKFREATLLLTVTTTGTDSTPSGGSPLIDPARPVG